MWSSQVTKVAKPKSTFYKIDKIKEDIPEIAKNELSLIYEEFPLKNQYFTQENSLMLDQQNIVTGNKLPIYSSCTRSKITRIEKKNLLCEGLALKTKSSSKVSPFRKTKERRDFTPKIPI